jgi:hypothetical protein
MTQHDMDAAIIEKIVRETQKGNKKLQTKLQTQIENEFSKSDDEMDVDCIDENIRTLIMLDNKEYIQDENVDQKLRNTQSQAKLEIFKKK